MSEDSPRAAMERLLMEKAQRSLSAAERDLAAGDPGLATNRVYYACFYAATAVLVRKGQVHAKHSSVRSAVHQQLVRSGQIPERWGKFYDRCMTERHEADYNALAVFEPEAVQDAIRDAREFIALMQMLLEPPADA